VIQKNEAVVIRLMGASFARALACVPAAAPLRRMAGATGLAEIANVADAAAGKRLVRHAFRVGVNPVVLSWPP
jgi:hypothetical protein